MSFWTDIRDTVESAAVVAGNYVLPGSGLVTSNLVSSGSQDQLGSGLGQLAMLGSGVAGGVAGNLSNYGKLYDAAGNFITGNESTAQQMMNSDIKEYVNQGYTQAEATSMAQKSLAAGAVGGAAATTPGGTTDWSKYLSAGLSSAGGLLSAGLQANAARQAAQTVADANLSSNQLLSRINEQNRARSEPFYQAGLSALPAYTQGVLGTEEDQKAGRYGNLVRPFSVNDWLANQDPARQLIMDEMGRATLHQAAAGTGGLSGVFAGNTAKALQDRAGQQANKFYSDAYNRYVGNQATQRNALAGLTGFAPTAAATMNAGDVAYGNQATNLASSTANAMGNADMSRASSYGNALAGAGSAFANAMNPNPMNQLMASWISKQLGA